MFKKTLLWLYRTFTIFVLVVYMGALTTHMCERGSSHRNIKTMGDALWWSLNVSTVGDSHLYPVTKKGRVVGAFLILFGYTIFAANVSIITAYICTELKHET